MVNHALSYGPLFERIERHLVILYVYFMRATFTHFSLLFCQKWQLRLILIAILNSWITALDAPHKNLCYASKSNIWSDEPTPHAIENVRDGKNVKAYHQKVDSVGNFWRRARLSRTYKTLLPAKNLRERSWVLSLLHSFFQLHNIELNPIVSGAVRNLLCLLQNPRICRGFSRTFKNWGPMGQSGSWHQVRNVLIRKRAFTWTF